MTRHRSDQDAEQQDAEQQDAEQQDPNVEGTEAAFTRDRVVGPPRMLRRRLLQLAGAAAAVGLVGAGGYVGFDRYRRFGRSGASMPDRRVLLPSGTPKMVVARGKSAVANVQAALARMGGMKSFVQSGDVVLIKPNVGWIRKPMHAATTNPEVVAELVRACLSAGAKEVVVADCPVDDAAQCFERSGIAAVADQAGAKVIRSDQSAFRAVTLSDALGTWDVLEALVTADKIINVPIVKHHGSAGVTAGMKNWIGITDKRRSSFHVNLDQTIAELAALMRPTLTVLDATRVLLRNGPRGGNLADVKKLDTLAMSVDPVAADAWAADLLEYPLSQVVYLELAVKLKLGERDYKKLGAVEINSG